MFLAKKSLRSYVGVYQKFLYKSFSLLLTPPTWYDGGCVWAKDHSVLLSSKSGACLQWSVHISQTRCRRSDWMISMCHINPKWHAAAFHTKPFSYLLRPLPGRPSIFPRCSRSSGRRGQPKDSFKKILPLLHQRSKIRPPHNLPQGTLFKMVFLMPTIGQNKLHLSGIRGWRLIMTWNQTPIMFFWLTLLLLTHYLRDINWGGIALIDVLW